MRTPKIERFMGDDGWRVRLTGANGEKVMVSEAYASKGNCTRAAKRLARLIDGALVGLLDGALVVCLAWMMLLAGGCITAGAPMAAARSFDNAVASKVGISEAQMNYLRDLVGLPTGADPLAGYEIQERRVDATGHEIRDPITITRTLTRVQVVSFGDLKTAVAPAPSNAVPADVQAVLDALPK